MTYRHVALMGRARTGKDTLAGRLVSMWAYTRVAFADPLKDMATALNPIVMYEPGGYGPLPVRLSDAVRRWGWETAKDSCPEVRRTLQRLGQAARDQDPNHWVSLAMDKIATADRWNLPVVVTDVRHVNECEALKNRGFVLVRVVRPGAPALGANAQHESETALDDYPADVTVANTGTLADLHCAADRLVQYR
ncbi:hypothetical protein [Streptomyces sp. NPDC056069]|uniref:deoxynucleotide monophosphate kinase family protein n=1 Tax=Streptomyces sp. NPDC056069 TaxID=3345702 RepID=UPI0035D853D6